MMSSPGLHTIVFFLHPSRCVRQLNRPKEYIYMDMFIVSVKSAPVINKSDIVICCNTQVFGRKWEYDYIKVYLQSSVVAMMPIVMACACE